MKNPKISNLPILRHFESDQIMSSGESFRKGEKGWYNLLKLAIAGTVLYFSWIYVLPVVFQAIGQVLAIGGTIAAIVLLLAMAPVILKAIRRFARFTHKMVINHDPFAELESQKIKMLSNQHKFRSAKGKIDGLKNEMEIEADTSAKNVSTLQKRILTYQDKAKTLKAEMETMVAKGGKTVKSSDEYINKRVKFMEVVSTAERMRHELNQEKDFVTKYGTRGAIMKKFGHKLLLVETSMDIKIKDFDATIEILKKDFDFAKKAKMATTAAKDAMLFTKGWELEYALDVVTSTIASDIAITSGNLKDIDSITANYAIDSDEMWANLDTLAGEIRTGKDPVSNPKNYLNPDYELTTEDRHKSGGFGKLF
tara:strand:+ start:6591 stop:7691 length:1101 start_codon:yes stop_codon:yes gene_type:complete